MGNGEKLLKDTLLYGIANFGSKILVFLMLPLYTHYFTTSEFGLWDVFMATTSLLAPFITFELVSATYRWLLDETSDDRRQTVITTGAMTIARNLLIFNIVGAIIILITSLPYGWLALIFINVDIMSSFIQQCARGLGYNKLFASIGIIQTIITISFILYFIFVLELRLEAFFYSSIIAGSTVIMFAWIIMKFHQYLNVHAYSKQIVKSFLKYSLPIIPGAASWWVMTMSDRYFITIYLGMEANGIFAVANKVPAVLLMINTVFFLAWKDSAIIEFNSTYKNTYYSTVFQLFFRLMATSVICLILLAKPVIRLVIAEDFYSSWKYTGLLLLSALFHTLALFWTAGYHGAKKTNVIFTTSIIGAAINVIVNILLIPFIGLYAVAVSTLLAFVVVWLIRLYASVPYFKITINVKDMAILFSLMIVAVVIPFTLTTKGVIISFGFGVVLFLIYNKTAITHVFQMIQSIVQQLKHIRH